MLKKLLFFIIFSSMFNANAQLKFDTWLFSVQPTLGGKIGLYTDKEQKFKDSFKKIDQLRQSIGFNIYSLIEIRNKNKLQIGLQYQNFGFTRKIEDIKFADTIHPKIGIRNDLVDVGPSWVEFRYRYHYIAIPFLFIKTIKESKTKPGSLHFVVGGALSGLIKQDINAKFFGFSFGKNKNVKFNEDDVNAGIINANIQIGIRYENKVYGENTSIYLQPNLYCAMLPSNYGVNKSLLYSLGLEIGIKHYFEKK